MMNKNGSKWDVGNYNLPVSSWQPWQWAYDNLTTEMHRDVHRFGAMAPDESTAVIDFIIELVSEIERLETELYGRSDD